MSSRWLESKVVVILAVAVMSGCSSDDAGETDADMTGSGGGISGTGGSDVSMGGSSSDVGAMGGASSDVGAMGGASGATTPGFAADIWPILTANCGNISCHGDGSFLPQHAHSDVQMAYAEAQPVADLIAGRVSGQLMPIMPQFCGPAPGLGECLSLAEVQLIQAWAEAGAPY